MADEKTLSVTMDFSIFSIKDGSKAQEVAKVLKWMDKKNIRYKLGAMGTTVECSSMKEALKILEKAHERVDEKRVYIVAKFDVYEGRHNAMASKIASVQSEMKGMKKG